MSVLCHCDNPFRNTGTKDCPSFLAIGGVILVPLIDAAGLRNSIKITDSAYIADKKQYIKDKFNNIDPLSRFYPFYNIKNATADKADSVFDTFDDDTKIFVKEGVRSFAGLIPKGSTQLAGIAKSFRCAKNNIGAYLVDISGNILGISEDGNIAELFPIDIASETIDAPYIFAASKTTSRVSIKFDFEQFIQDGDFQMLSAEDLAPANMLSLGKTGLYDVLTTVDSTSTTQIVFDAWIQGVSLGKKHEVRHLLITDFYSGSTPNKIFNATTSAPISLISVAEDPITPGKYTLTYAAQTAGDVLIVSVKKEGYDFSELREKQNVVA